MGTTVKLTFEDYEKLPEREGTPYELDEGELLMEASPALRHNLIRQRIAMKLMEFVESNGLGVVIEEMDFRLGPNTVRNPDVAFITSDHLKNIDLDQSPVQGAPALAIEVLSPGNRAEDTVKKIHQYLSAGSVAVWVIYPTLRLAEVYTAEGVQVLREPETLKEPTLLPGFSLSLSYILDGSKQHDMKKPSQR
jgi:Uma2 family endonuclease